MFDLGESRTLVFDTEREKRDIKLALPWCMLSACAPRSCMRGVLGEGVRGARPPARRVEKIPSRRDLMGVSTDGVAISAYYYALVSMFLYCKAKYVNGSAASNGVFGDSQMAQLRDPLVYFANISAVAVDGYA